MREKAKVHSLHLASMSETTHEPTSDMPCASQLSVTADSAAKGMSRVWRAYGGRQLN